MKRKTFAVLGGVMLAGTFATVIGASAQDAGDLKTAKSPLVLKAQGSFFVGGELISAEAGDLGAGRAAGQIVINQMYVEYMVPEKAKVPVVMVEGGGLSGKSWETTPDGRMGWDEYFVRKGYPSYVADQVWRGRSGSDVTVFNRVRDGRLPPTALPSMVRTAAQLAWTAFRFGPTYGVPFPDTQFPVEAIVEFAKQGVPSFSILPPGAPNPNYKALSDLAIKLKGAVLMGHSQSGLFPAEAALVASTGAKGLILAEAGLPPAYTDEQIAKLATVPILVIFADHLGPGEQARFDAFQALINRINTAGGNAKMLHPPALGIRGNSHMFMLDKNNLKIADLVMNWIDKNVKYKNSGHDHHDEDDDHGHHH